MLKCNLTRFCRRVVCSLGVILFIFLQAACNVHEPPPGASDSTASQDLFYAMGTLNVDGKEMADLQVPIYQNSADIPLLELLQAVGCEIHWFDANVAQITYNNRGFRLDLAEMSMREQDETQEQGNTLNLLALPLAGRFRAHCSTESGVLMVDSTNCTWILHFMGIPTTTRIDHENTTVHILLR